MATAKVGPSPPDPACIVTFVRSTLLGRLRSLVHRCRPRLLAAPTPSPTSPSTTRTPHPSAARSLAPRPSSTWAPPPPPAMGPSCACPVW
ncbi:hypothetical protein ABZP36_036073 [Zizania latifolia]